MELSPEAIRDVRFREAWRGYDRADVDVFLDQVAGSVDTSTAAVEVAARAAADMRAKVHQLTAEAEDLRREIGGLEAKRDELAAMIAARSAHFAEEQHRLRAVLNELSARVDADLVVVSPPEGPLPDLDLDELATAESNDAFFADLQASIAQDDGSSMFRRRRG
jgi:DivIVA domain-containing protein